MSVRRCLFTAVALLVVQSPLFAAYDLRKAIADLQAGSAKADRIAATRWLREREEVEALQAIDELVAAVRDDDDDIRNEAILALGTLCERHKRSCPLVLIEAMADSNDLIRTHATAYVDFIKDTPPEALPLLTKYASHPNPVLRRSAMTPLAVVASNDPLERFSD